MPLFLLIALPLLMLWLGVHAAVWAKHLTERHRGDKPLYPTAEVLEAIFEEEREGVWPPKPALKINQMEDKPTADGI